MTVQDMRINGREAPVSIGVIVWNIHGGRTARVQTELLSTNGQVRYVRHTVGVYFHHTPKRVRHLLELTADRAYRRDPEFSDLNFVAFRKVDGVWQAKMGWWREVEFGGGRREHRDSGWESFEDGPNAKRVRDFVRIAAPSPYCPLTPETWLLKGRRDWDYSSREIAPSFWEC